jgi:3-methyladenine DNA glycosylase AlkC
MPAPDRQVHKPLKRSTRKRITTLNDIFTRDDVNGILNDLDKVKPNINDLVVIYVDAKNHKCDWLITDGTLVSTAIWMLESVKLDLLYADDEEE